MCRTVVQERQFEAICQRLLNAKNHCANTKQSLIELKRNKPKVVSHRVVNVCNFCILVYCTRVVAENWNAGRPWNALLSSKWLNCGRLY